MASPGPANPFRTASNCTQHLPVPQPQPVDKTDGSTMDISSQRRRTSRNNLPPVLAVDTDSTSPSPTINGPSPGCSLRRRISPANSRNCHTDNNAAAFASSSIIRPGMMMQRAAEPSAATIPATGTTSAFDASPNNDDDDDANSLEAILEPDDCSVSHQEEEDTGGDMYPNCRNHRVVDTEQETDFLSLCRNATNSFDLANLSSRISLGSASTSSSSTNSSTTALHELSRNKALATAAQFPIPPSRGSTSSRPGNHNHSTVSPMAAVATNSAGLEDRRRSTRSLSHLVLDRANSTASNDSSGTSSSVQTLLTIEAQERFREELRTVVQLLWTAYPPAMMTTDGQGCIPFEEALRDWVLACYRCNNDKNGDTAAAAAPSSNPVLGGSNRDGNGNRSSNSLSSSIWKLKESIVSQWANKNSSRKSNGAYYYPNNNNNASCMSTSTLGSAATRNPPMTTPLTPPPLSRSHQMKSDVELGCNNNSPSVKTTGTPDNDDTYTTILVRKDRVFPRRAVRLSAHALNSVAMLSMLLERMEEEVSAPATTSSTNARSSTRRDRRSMADELQTFTVQDMSASIVHSIAVIPDLMQTILFLEDAEQRKQLLETTLMRRVLICTHSIGNWLTEMLQSHDKQASYLALDYLHLVSDASFVVAEPHDSVPTSVKSLTSRKRLEEADRLRDEFYQEVSRLQDFVPSLLSLSEQHIEEAATTNVVQQVLDRVMSRPFVVMVVFCDAIFLALLIYGFRRAVNGVLLGRDRANVLGHIFIANIATFYFALREIGKAVSLCMITRRVRLYFTVWNWIDLVTTILALASSVAIRSQFSGLRSICAITTGFMWLRVLSYLKGINMQLATFVLAILQVRGPDGLAKASIPSHF